MAESKEPSYKDKYLVITSVALALLAGFLGNLYANYLWARTEDKFRMAVLVPLIEIIFWCVVLLLVILFGYFGYKTMNKK